MRKKFYSLVFMCAFYFTVKAQNIVQLSFYSPLISTFDMKYTDNHLIVSQDGLLIFDVTNPLQRPRLVSQVFYPGDIAYNVAVNKDQAYMAHGNNGIFAVYDISNFQSPVLKGSVAIPSTSFYLYGDLEPFGEYVYLSGFDSIYVINVSNSASPFLANVFAIPHNDFYGAESMSITNNTLFVEAPSGVLVYDIHDPVHPALLNTIPYSSQHPYRGELSADTVRNRIFIPWLATLQQYEGYDAYDVNTPSSPKFLFADSTTFGGGDFGISAFSYNDNVLYLSKGGGINAFDASTANHRFVTSFTGEDIPNASVAIDVRDSVFFNARGGGIEVLKFTNTVPPVCNPPSILRSKVEGTSAALAWNNAKDAKGYIVRYRQVNRGWNYLASKDNVQRITNLLPNTLYYWEVSSVCNVAEKFRSDFSLTQRFTTESNIISITPNPVHDNFRISIKDFSVNQLIITNSFGNTVVQLQNVKDGQTISFSNMQPGTYLLQLLNAQNEVVGLTKIFKH